MSNQHSQEKNLLIHWGAPLSMIFFIGITSGCSLFEESVGTVLDLELRLETTRDEFVVSRGEDREPFVQILALLENLSREEFFLDAPETNPLIRIQRLVSGAWEPVDVWSRRHLGAGYFSVSPGETFDITIEINSETLKEDHNISLTGDYRFSLSIIARLNESESTSIGSLPSARRYSKPFRLVDSI